MGTIRPSSTVAAILLVLLCCCAGQVRANVSVGIAVAYIIPLNVTLIAQNVGAASMVALLFVYGVWVRFRYTDASGDLVPNTKAIHQQWIAATLFALLTGAFFHWLFEFPRLAVLALFHQQQFDQTPANLKDTIREAEQKRAKPSTCPPPDVWRRFETTAVAWFPPFFLVLSTLIITIGIYLLCGFGNTDFGAARSRNFGIAFVAAGTIAGIAAFVWIALSVAPNDGNLRNGRWTLKYLLALAVLCAVPVYYVEQPFGLATWLEGLITALLFAVVWLAFLFYARSVARDPYFSAAYFEPNTDDANAARSAALWFAILGWIANALPFIALGIANHISLGDVDAALLAIVAAMVLTWILFVIIRGAAFAGYLNIPEACEQAKAKEVDGRFFNE